MLKVTAIDRDVLPQALLADAKAHARIDGTDDDAQMLDILARVINKFEDVNEVTVNPTTVEWSIGLAAFKGSAADLPVRPVVEFTAEAGDPAADVSADYAIVLKHEVGIHGLPIQVLAGAPAALDLELTAGYADLVAMPPSVKDKIIRAAAYLFEHRELETPGRGELAVDLKTDGTWWMPRV